MKKNSITLSVIVPVYNAAPYVGALLDSLLAQTYQGRVEFILVNDGSTDNSLAVCLEYAAVNATVKVIDQPNGGVSRARNRGLAVATGKYITFADADDTVAPDMYMEMVSSLEVTGADIVSCSVSRVEEGGTPGKPSAIGGVRTYDTKQKIIRAFLNESLGGVGVWNKVIRRDMVAGLMFPENYKYNEDKLYLFEAISLCRKVVHRERAMYFYYERAGSATTKPISPALFDIEEVVRVIEDSVLKSAPDLEPEAKVSSIVALLRLYRTILLASNRLEYTTRQEQLKRKIYSYGQFYKRCDKITRTELFVLKYAPGLYSKTFIVYNKTMSKLR